jgi:hypothetical protein
VSPEREQSDPDAPTERVTFAYLHAQLDKINGKVDKLRWAVLILAVAIMSPKAGGPEVHQAVAALREAMGGG